MRSTSSSVQDVLEGSTSGFASDGCRIILVGIERRIKIDQVHALRVEATHDGQEPVRRIPIASGSGGLIPVLGVVIFPGPLFSCFL